jgi:hypothetical protein
MERGAKMASGSAIIVEHWGSLYRMSRKRFDAWASDVANGNAQMAAPPGKRIGTVYRDVTEWTRDEARAYVESAPEMKR